MNPGIVIGMIVGLLLLIGGAEALIRGAAQAGRAVGLPPIVIGLTIVAFATSSPELAVSVQAAFAGQADLALGNVIGSNIVNILLILGMAATIAPLRVAEQLLRLDVPLMIGLSILIFLFGFDGQISRLEGLSLVGLAVGYTVFAIRQSRRESAAVQAEYIREYGQRPQTGQAFLIQLALMVIGLVGLVWGAQWLVEGATAIAQALGVSDLIVGLTIVAVGTSLPEVAASVVASLRKERDIAVGNAIGSNIFNLVGVLGLTASLAPAGIPVPADALRVDMPVMIFAAVACLPIFFAYGQITRGEGLLFLGGYGLYLLYIILTATQNSYVELFRNVIVLAVLPLTVVFLLVRVIHTWRRR